MDNIRQRISANIFGNNADEIGCEFTASEHCSNTVNIKESLTNNTSQIGCGGPSMIKSPMEKMNDDTSPEDDIIFVDDDVCDGGEEIGRKNKEEAIIDSTYELLDYTSPEQDESANGIENGWSNVIRHSNISGCSNLSVDSSGITATGQKKHENNSMDERDTHSPLSPTVSNINNSIFTANVIQSSVMELPLEDKDNNGSGSSSSNSSKLLRRTYFNSGGTGGGAGGSNGIEYTRLSSKEEKQRQNEEIVIMESSSVSSETGSWESVFPQYTPLDLKEYCKLFLLNERKYTTVLSIKPVTVPKNPSSPPLETEKSENAGKCNKAMGACFIDASSLLDDTEILYSIDNIGPKLPDVECCGPAPSFPINLNLNNDKSLIAGCSMLPQQEVLKIEKSLEKIDKSIPNNGSIKSSNSKSNTPDMNSPNLSDEQKLLHRDFEQHITDNDIKDQYAQDDGTITMLADQTGNTSSTKNIDKEFKFRQEQERKQGHFLFKNSIQHFSGNIVNGKHFYSDNDNSMHSVLSATESEILSNEDSGQQLESFGDLTSVYSHQTSETESVFYPDTPHNSIINIDSPRSSSRVDDNIDGGMGYHSSVSPPENGIKIPKKVNKCDESAPILSGGVSVDDFTPKQCSSPSVVRRSEACPILCVGGSFSSDFLDSEKPLKKLEKPNNLVLNSWVVDMSDCTVKSKRQRSESSSSSTDNTATSKSFDHRSSDRSGTDEHKSSSLGFYVSLNNIKATKNNDETIRTMNNNQSVLSENKKMSEGFYVNLSDDEHRKPKNIAQKTENIDLQNDSKDKKSIFSMFIDFDEGGSSGNTASPKGPSSFPCHLNSALRGHQLSQSDCANNTSSSTSESNRSSGIFCEKPEVLRRSLSSNISNSNKRHSWNNTMSKDRMEIKTRDLCHSRSASLSAEQNVIMNILDKVPHLSKTSSMSIDSPNSLYDDFTCSKSLGSYSNDSNSLTSISVHSSLEPKLHIADMPPSTIMTSSARRRQRDAKINETFDKSSQGSLTDGILSKDSSPTTTNTDTDDITFQNDGENMIGSNTMMETIVESNETASPQKKKQQSLSVAPVKQQLETHTMETLQATIEKQKKLLETVSEEVQLSSFVKLSDMDKPVPMKFELHPEENLSKSTGSSSRIGRLFIDTRNNAQRNAIMSHMSKSTGTNLTNLASSVENLRSLSRLFPHLSKELSSSLPADIQTEDIIKKSPSSECAPLDILSCTSSLTSSFSRSGIDSADESSLSCRQPRRLGEDLLKMFLQEIATDVIIEVGGRRMRAHKCILRSRCQYFAAILAGGWVQSAGNVISIPGYSYGSVHFALCHIYSGASHPPDGISLMELAALADLLGLEGLKEVTAHALRTNYCHNFHKPCSGCIDGILQVFPITLNHGLDDLYRKCLRWTCKYFAKVWPTRAFSQLPIDIITRCKQHVIAHLTSETVLMTILEFDQLISLLAPCRWAVGVENTVRDIIDIAHSYISDHFANLLASDGFLSLGHGQSWNISRLENILLRIASTLTPEQACKSYQRVTRLNAVLAAKVIKLPSPVIHIQQEFGDMEEEMDWNSEFIRLVDSILSAVEQCLTRQCARAMRNNQWLRMDVELRNKIQKLACLSDPVEMRHATKSTKSLNYNLCLNNHNRNQSLHQIKLAIRAHSKQPTFNNHYKATAHTQTNADYNADGCEFNVVDDGNYDTKSICTIKACDSIVPDVVPSVKTRTTYEKPSPLQQRRNQLTEKVYKSASATHINKPALEKPKILKLADVKPRYLETFKQRNTNQIAKQNPNKATVVKTKNISSSESSTRNSSPASNRRMVGKTKNTNDSTSMSRDSLASPAKQNKTFRQNVPRNDNFGMSVDSLGDSLKSSIQTDKTSQESLVVGKCNVKIAPKNGTNPTKSELRTIPNGSNTNKDAGTKKLLKKNKSASCQTTTENSPASATTKSSRLSSITSTVSSPRDALRTRTNAVSNTAGGNNNGSMTVVRKSFLSAKSKEILAKKQALNQSESTKSVPNTIKENLSIPVNKSSSTSNILLKRKPNPFTTTLHLRKTATLNTGSINVGTIPTTVSKIKNNFIHTIEQKANKLKPMKKQLHPTNRDIENCDESMERIQSKLERSSTFCKESSDIPISALQVIE